MTWLTSVIEALPKIRTKLQLSGLIVAVAAVVATRAVVPQAVNAQLSAGAIGVLFIVFGQVFSSLKDFSEQERSRLVLLLFGTFCVFVVTLVVITGLFVSRADSFSKSRTQDPNPSATPLNAGVTVPEAAAKEKLGRPASSEASPAATTQTDHPNIDKPSLESSKAQQPDETTKAQPTDPLAIIWRDNYQLLLDAPRIRGSGEDGRPQIIDKRRLYDMLDRLDLSGETELQSLKAEIVSIGNSQVETDDEKEGFSVTVNTHYDVFLRADIRSKLRSLIKAVRRKALSEGIDVEAMEKKSPRRDSTHF